MPWSAVHTDAEAREFTGRVQKDIHGPIPDREEVLEYEDPDTEDEAELATQPFTDLRESQSLNLKPQITTPKLLQEESTTISPMSLTS